MTRVLLAVCGSLTALGAVPARSSAEPLADVTQELIRQRVGEYLRNRPDAVPALAKQVGVELTADAREIQYERREDGRPVRLLWRYRVLGPLTPDQRADVHAGLANILDAALGRYAPPGGRPLLTPADLAAMLRVYAFERVEGAAAAPGAAPTVAALPPPPLPMAGRVFPVYPLYPTGGPTYIAYAPETFVAADRTGYFLYAAPAEAWSVRSANYVLIPHPQAAEVAARFPPPVEQLRAGPAAVLQDEGYAAFWAGDYARARQLLEAATARDRTDSRSWAYLALTRWAEGDDAAGDAAARYGAAAAILYPDAGLPLALERVQGPPRRRLNAVAAGVPTVAEAEKVMARLVGK